jgi:hypothetical protein
MLDEEPTPGPLFRDDLWYQLMIVHDKHGEAVEYPVYDLGWFSGNKALVMASHLGGAAIQAGHDGPHEGEATNILEAWASLDYRVWFLPSDLKLPCLEYRDQQVTISEDDPR